MMMALSLAWLLLVLMLTPALPMLLSLSRVLKFAGGIALASVFVVVVRRCDWVDLPMAVLSNASNFSTGISLGIAHNNSHYSLSRPTDDYPLQDVCSVAGLRLGWRLRRGSSSYSTTWAFCQQ